MENFNLNNYQTSEKQQIDISNTFKFDYQTKIVNLQDLEKVTKKRCLHWTWHNCNAYCIGPEEATIIQGFVKV